MAQLAATDASLTTTRGRPSGSFRSLRMRNFRLFLLGQSLSQSGSWLHLVAQSWLAYELTGSGTALGWVTVATFAPILVLGPWAGSLADRLDKRRLLIAVQALAAGQAGALAALVLAGALTVPLLYLLALAYGLLYAVENPTPRAFVAETVGPPDIANAASLNSTVAAVARVVGPASAGALIVGVGVGWCFAVNALSFLAALTGLGMMRRGQLHPAEPARRERRQVRAGLRYAWRVPELRSALLLTAVVGTLGFNHQVVIPLLAERTFAGGAGGSPTPSAAATWNVSGSSSQSWEAGMVPGPTRRCGLR